MDRKTGFTVLELVVALTIALVALSLAMRQIASLVRAHSRVVHRVDQLESARTARHVLSGEVSAGVYGRDWTVVDSDSLRVRAFRGLGQVLGQHGPGVCVRWEGDREPEPAKDSVLLLESETVWRAHRLQAVGSECSGRGSSGIWWTVEPAPTAPVLVRLFEPVSYHVGDGSLRVRSGRGGRQPITATLDDPPRLFSRSGSAMAQLTVARFDTVTWLLGPS